MRDKDNSTENQVFTLGEEVMKVMVEDLRKNTETIAGNGVQIGQLSGTIGELAGMRERMEALEKEVVSAKEELVAVKRIVDRPGISEKSIEGLRMDLMMYATFFEKPAKKEIHHRHFIGWPVVVICVLVAGVVLSWTLMGMATVRAERYSENDIKWRYAKLIKNSVTLRELDSAEKKYQENPDQFRSYVLGEEQRIRELTEKLLEEEENREQIDALRKKEKRY